MQRKDNSPRPPSAFEEPGAKPTRPIEDENTSPSKARGSVPPGSGPHDSARAKAAVEAARVTEQLTGDVPDPSEIRPAVPLPAATQPPPLTRDRRIGETLVGRYRLEKLVGKGGMGRVYRATQIPLNRPVAVKILSPEFQKKDPQFVRRFYLEAASAARLTHPNTITVFDYGEAESGELFIAMEYLKGRSLAKAIATDGPFNAERTLHVGMQICRALREAHAKGIIHRDLKPGNILLLEEGDDADFVKVLDFGLVKLFNPNVTEPPEEDPLTPDVAPEGELTKAGMFLGSPKYMSPEQIQGHPLDPRTDIYSLGVLMYQMVSGRPPFIGATSVEVIYKHVNEPVPTFAKAGVQVPLELEDVIDQMLAKRREERFESMNATLGRLKDVRRLLTGISASVETGIDIDLSDLAAAAAKAQPRVVAQGGSTPSGPARPTPPVGTPIATAVSREAAFAETPLAEDTGSGAVLRRSRKPATSGSSLGRAAPYIAGGAFVVVLGALAFVASSSLSERTAELPPPPSTGEHAAAVIEDEPVIPAPAAKVRVRFESAPEGAEVFEHGVSLGVTPFEAELPRDRPGAEPREFLFKKKGFLEETELTAIAGDQMVVEAQLRPAPGARKTPEDYKENPY